LFQLELITCWQRRLEQMGQMHQQQEQMRQQQALVQEQQLEQLAVLSYHKQRERQQPRGSPTGAILSCQFSFSGIKQFLEIVMACTMTELMELPPEAQPSIIG
jgi:hypothetical protein